VVRGGEVGGPKERLLLGRWLGKGVASALNSEKCTVLQDNETVITLSEMGQRAMLKGKHRAVGNESSHPIEGIVQGGSHRLPHLVATVIH